MTTFRLKYVQAFTDRYGKRRYYFRRPGLPRVAIPGLPGSEAFMEAYKAALRAEPKAIGPAPAEGSMSALIAAYYGSTGFKNLAAITRKTYRNDMERFRAKYGHLSVKGLEARHIRKLLDQLADKPGAAYSLRRILRVLMKFAVEYEWRLDNPTLGIKKARRKTDGFIPWSEEDIAAYEGRWPLGTRERLALDLLLYTVQRRADVVTMGRQHVRKSTVRVVQRKTGTELWIPLHPRLKASIAACPSEHLTFLVTAYGSPFTPAGFTNWFVEAAKAAGLKNRTPHGLRKAGARRLAEAGCTANQIMAVTGHKSLSEVTHYTDAADQRRLADEAMAKMKEPDAVKSGSPV